MLCGFRFACEPLELFSAGCRLCVPILALVAMSVSVPGGEPTSRSFRFEGTAVPLEFEVDDPAAHTANRGLSFPALAPGTLLFSDSQIKERWEDPTVVLHFRRGEKIASISDPDFEAQLAADRGRLAPLRAELDRMRRIMQQTPASMASLRLIIKEGEALLFEADIREREMERTATSAVIAPADAEIIEGTRHSVNINPNAAELFRYYPLSHIRFQARIPLAAWSPDWHLTLDINRQPAQILKIFSADLDETNREWILGIEFKPSTSFASINESFEYQLVTSPPLTRILVRADVAWHAPSCGIVGRRRVHRLDPPKVPGMLQFSKPENVWVESGEKVGGVKQKGMANLLRELGDYRIRVSKLLRKIESDLIPDGVVAKNEPLMISLRQYHARSGRMLERAGAMTIEAKQTGLLIGTLDYVGPISGTATIAAHIRTPFVELTDVLIPRTFDVRDGDIVLVTLPSGGQRLAQVYQVTSENIGLTRDLRDAQRVSVLIYSPEFGIGEASSHSTIDKQSASTSEHGMPVYVQIPKYDDTSSRSLIQAQLKLDFESLQQEPTREQPLYPVRISFQSNTLSPLEKMAYMQLANDCLDDANLTPAQQNDRYVKLLTKAITREQNPEARWTAFRRLVDRKFTSSFGPFVEIATRASPDVAGAALFHLKDKKRPFELFAALQLLKNAASPNGRDASEAHRSTLAYSLLRSMLDYPDPRSDALKLLVKRAREDSQFYELLRAFFENLIHQEGVNAPASIRILRGEEDIGHPFLTEPELADAERRAKDRGDDWLSRVYYREQARRTLLGVSKNARYGYGADFIENGFLYLRDLEMIDSLVRSRQNYRHDLRFLESSPNWIQAFQIDPMVVAEQLPSLNQLDRHSSLPGSLAGAVSNNKDLEIAAFRQLSQSERSRWIRHLGAKQRFATLVLFLRDPVIRSRYVGDILDWLLATSQSRQQLARYYAVCEDTDFLDAVEQRRFVVEVLSDVDAVIQRLETSVVSTRSREEETARSSRAVAPSTICVYQDLVRKLLSRTEDQSKRRRYWVAWLGLLPSAFELRDDVGNTRKPWSDLEGPTDEISLAVQYVRQRRALRHAIARERDKRSETPQVEIRPGPEEALMRQALQQVEPGMPVSRQPFAVFDAFLTAYVMQCDETDRSILPLQDIATLVRLRDRDFSTGHRERLRFRDILRYVAQIVLSPLYLLAIVPIVCVLKAVSHVVSELLCGSTEFSPSFRRRLKHSKRLLNAMEDGSTVKREIVSWMKTLESTSTSLKELERLQVRVKRVMNAREIVYRMTDPDEIARETGDSRVASNRPDTLHPDVTLKLAPRLTLLVLMCRLTAERVLTVSKPGDGKRAYWLLCWFMERAGYFAGYRYSLNPLTNHQIAETYIWTNIPRLDLVDYSSFTRTLVLPLNVFIALVNIFGQVFLSLPMRFVYLFMPISMAGSALFQFCLRRMVIERGNRLEEHLYPNPERLMAQTRRRLRTGWSGRESMPDQPGGRYIFGFRRIATRVLPFIVVATVAGGGFPYLYEALVEGGRNAVWNIRSTGVYAAFAATFLLTLAMVLHWLPLLTGWIPFDFLRTRIAMRTLRARARRRLMPDRLSRGKSLRGTRFDSASFPLTAADELRRVYLDEAMQALREEQAADSPILDLLVLMVEDPRLLEKYRRLAKSLVNSGTAVVALTTAESMDGGGARLSAMKTVTETYAGLRRKYPNLPDRFEDTRSCFMPLGKDCDSLAPLPVQVALRADHEGELTSFVLAVANVQAFMRNSFVDEQSDLLVGSITATPQRLYVGPHDADQGGRFRSGITLVGAFECIESATRLGSMVLLGDRAFIRTSAEKLQRVIQRDPVLRRRIDSANFSKRQLPVAQLVIERFRTAERYGRHVATCVRYIDEIQAIRNDLLEAGRQNERDVDDEEFLNSVAIHYMRHLIVPWFIAYRGGSLDGYRSSVLTENLGVRDRRRAFHQRVLELIELFQEEGRLSRRQLPKVRFCNSPTARIFYGKTAEDIECLRSAPHILFSPVREVASQV